MAEQRLTPGQIRKMTADSAARSEARRAPMSARTRRILTGVSSLAIAGTTFLLANGMHGGDKPSGTPEGKQDGNAPEDTRTYLEGLPTKTVTIGAGEGVDDAVYAVDPNLIDKSANIKEGVTEIVESQVGKTPSGTPLPQAGEQVNVPDLPNSFRQIPPEAK